MLAVPLLRSVRPFRKRNVKLRKHMTRRQGHLAQIRRVPRAQDDPPVVRLVLQLVNDLRQLIDPLARVIRLRIHVLGAEMPPLETIDGSQVSDFSVREADAVEVLAAAVAVPDLDARFRERQGRSRAGDKPEELGDDGAEKDPLGGQEW